MARRPKPHPQMSASSAIPSPRAVQDTQGQARARGSAIPISVGATFWNGVRRASTARTRPQHNVPPEIRGSGIAFRVRPTGNVIRVLASISDRVLDRRTNARLAPAVRSRAGDIVCGGNVPENHHMTATGRITASVRSTLCRQTGTAIRAQSAGMSTPAPGPTAHSAQPSRTRATVLSSVRWPVRLSRHFQHQAQADQAGSFRPRRRHKMTLVRYTGWVCSFGLHISHLSGLSTVISVPQKG